MNAARRNHPPYQAGAGVPPPKFAGREDILDDFDRGLDALENGLYANPHAIIGARGLGKTVLMGELATIAQERGWQATTFEVSAGQRLEEQLLAAAEALIANLAPTKTALNAFAKELRATTNTLTVGTTQLAPITLDWSITKDFTPGIAGSDLNALFLALGDLARQKHSGAALFIDELHEANAESLTSLAVALQALSKTREHRPMQVIGAGLPLLVGKMMNAGTYGERIFELWEVEPLTPSEVIDALRSPAQGRGRDFDDDALQAITDETRGYPFFVQRWGIEVWRQRESGDFTLKDVEHAKPKVIEHLDKNFYRLRASRLSNRENEYVIAMAQLPERERTSGAVAAALGRSSSDLSPVRDALIRKGIIAAPAHGRVAFTAPGFDGYLLRAEEQSARLGV